MRKEIKIGNKVIGDGHPTFVIAEMSGNHNLDYARAEAIIYAAKESGVDAIKLQTYTADTITLDSSEPYFNTEEGGLWEGQSLYELYKQAYTPWEWQPKLKSLADELGLILFSSPFDETAVDFLEEMEVPAYKIASFEINDIGLIRKVAQTGKPIIMSTGIAAISDIELAIKTCKEENNDQIILLKCTSAYPAPYEEMNLRLIQNMKETFNCCTGISDHSLGDEVAIAATALGANVIEKHFTIRRSEGGVDSEFSMEAEEMALMVNRIRNVEKALGRVDYTMTKIQEKERYFSRSLFVATDVKKGDIITRENVRSVRPGIGLHTKYLDKIIGKRVTRDIKYATPLSMGDIEW
ncbi:MAG: pseudaminic acid synthase [Bacteroides sp.]|nr:pseudaminic acid synthase [Bacteroides sp.]MCM1549030.1 pseudaminic acid synthase [Clostridium sp.]